MHERTKKINKAMKSSKEHFDNQCVISMLSDPDGCHILPRGSFPEQSDLKYNIIPLARHWHHEFDKMQPGDKMNWLINHSHPDVKNKVREWMDELWRYNNDTDIYWRYNNDTNI